MNSVIYRVVINWQVCSWARRLASTQLYAKAGKCVAVRVVECMTLMTGKQVFDCWCLAHTPQILDKQPTQNTTIIRKPSRFLILQDEIELKVVEAYFEVKTHTTLLSPPITAKQQARSEANRRRAVEKQKNKDCHQTAPLPTDHSRTTSTEQGN